MNQEIKNEIIKEFDDRFVEMSIGRDMANRPPLYDVKTKDVNEIKQFIIEAITKTKEEMRITGETSDGYHTFNELYDFRKVFNACLFNEWYKQGKYEVHKSKKHFDGEECFGGGWFIVVAILPTGQISNHYELKDWDLFQCEEVEKAKYEFDGHTPQDVLERLTKLK